MSIPVLQVPSIPNTRVVGDVTIDPTAIIAPGVILNATPGCRIVIKSGACLGMGTIITAIGGDVVVESNAILGAGSLIVGACVIGTQASLGALVTIYRADVPANAVISAGTILGDSSRKPPCQSPPHPSPPSAAPVQQGDGNEDNQSPPTPPSSTTTQETKQGVEQENTENAEAKAEEEDPWHQEETPSQTSSAENSNVPPDASHTPQPDTSAKKSVVGRVYVNKLLFTLFPDRNSKPPL